MHRPRIGGPSPNRPFLRLPYTTALAVSYAAAPTYLCKPNVPYAAALLPYIRPPVSYEAAPTCSPPVANYTADNSGRLWGYQNGSSCAFRFADGKPVYQANVTSGGAVSLSTECRMAAGAGAVAGVGAGGGGQ